MCTEVWFKHEGKQVGSIRDLAGLVGGFDRLAIREDGEAFDPAQEADTCLCHIDIERTLADTDWHLLRWEDHCEFTAIKSSYAIDRDQRAHDLARYEAAMAEMKALKAKEPPNVR